MGKLIHLHRIALPDEMPDDIPTVPVLEWGDDHFDPAVRDHTRIGPAGLFVIAVAVLACMAYWAITGA